MAAHQALRPWDSPSKNTGVGCQFLLQCMKVKSESEVAQSCPTPSDPTDCSLPGPSFHGIFQARVPEWVAIAFSGDICLGVELLDHMETVFFLVFKSIYVILSAFCQNAYHLRGKICVYNSLQINAVNFLLLKAIFFPLSIPYTC